MRKIIPALALLLFTSSVHAGELDGKFIYCPADSKGYKFSSVGYVAELKIVYWKKERENRVTFVIPFGAEYTAGTRYVRWKTENLLLGKITGRYRLDRRTVKLWRSGKTFQCHLSSESKIRSKLKAVIARAKRKNKL